MRINVTFRHMEATDALREHAEKRVRRIAKYVHRPVDAHVILSVVKRRHIAEVVFKADRATMTAKEETGDLYSAIDLAGDKLEQRARKHTEKLKSHKLPPPSRRLKEVAPELPEPTSDTATTLRMDVLRSDSFGRRKGPEVIHTKRLTVKPMSVEEAVMQMDLMSSEFFVFRNGGAGIAVVYRRKDGHYGLIEPEPA
ncbi:MAG: ribosome-associated translation inhibitor RaiA [Candidatus Binatia bacterium]